LARQAATFVCIVALRRSPKTRKLSLLFFMNVHVENQPNCITTLRVEVPAEKVTETWDAIARDYARYARIPGYRAGKAPRVVIESKFKKEIREELQKKLLSESCREAISSKQIRIISLAEVKDLELDKDKAMRFTATLVRAPDFALPDYKSIPVQIAETTVIDEDIDRAIENLRNQAADFMDINGRGLQMEDYAVIDYRGTIDGQAVDQVFPKAGKPLTANQDFWLRMTPEAFFPGFCEHLIGTLRGDERQFSIKVPADFAVAEMAGREIRYEVIVKELKQKVLPELNDEFAAKMAPGKSIAEMRELVRHQLEHEKEHEIERETKNQVMTYLLSKVECELPSNLLRHETRRILADIVRDNQVRGVADEVIRESEKELVGAAAQSARDRLKGSFILLRIGEAEKITVTREEFDGRVTALARHYQLSREKMVKELEKRNALEQINEDMLTGKVLDFLRANASVQRGPAGDEKPPVDNP
jgi:trigger factor